MEISQKLIHAAIKKDERALKELYMLLHEPLMRVCIRYYPQAEDAQLIMHEGMLKIFDKLKKYNAEGGSFLNWCRVITMRTIIDDIRRNRKRLDFKHIEDLSDKPDNRAEAQAPDLDYEHWEYVDEVLSILPPASRVVFNLYVFEEYTHREIASALGISANTSKWHLAHCRKILLPRMKAKAIIIQRAS